MPKDNFAAPPRRPFEEIIHEELFIRKPMT